MGVPHVINNYYSMAVFRCLFSCIYCLEAPIKYGFALVTKGWYCCTYPYPYGGQSSFLQVYVVNV